ncbi:MAG: DUF72 domain-containing protein [bacterium]
MPRTVKPHQIAPDLDETHDGGFVAASERAALALQRIPPEQLGQPLLRDTLQDNALRIGTASWTDPTITKGGVFYPRGVSSSEDRLRYYASQFPVVEVDSTYYSLPERAIASLWAERTPPHFVFHVKAHALMTGQPTEVSRLPEPLIDALPAGLAEKARLYAKDLPLELYDAVWTHFLDALEPLRTAGKLGGILLQYPRWFLPTPENKDHLAESAVRLAGTPGAVELRNHHWYGGTDGQGRATQWTMDMLRDLGLTYVMVDGPQGLESSVPPIAAVTTPELAMVRLHGRRSATWEAAKVPTVERYRYLYTPAELEAWVPRIDEASAQARRTTVFLNNCYGNYGTTNARELMARLV